MAAREVLPLEVAEFADGAPSRDVVGGPARARHLREAWTTSALSERLDRLLVALEPRWTVRRTARRWEPRVIAPRRAIEAGSRRGDRPRHSGAPRSGSALSAAHARSEGARDSELEGCGWRSGRGAGRERASLERCAPDDARRRRQGPGGARSEPSVWCVAEKGALELGSTASDRRRLLRRRRQRARKSAPARRRKSVQLLRERGARPRPMPPPMHIETTACGRCGASRGARGDSFAPVHERVAERDAPPFTLIFSSGIPSFSSRRRPDSKASLIRISRPSPKAGFAQSFWMAGSRLMPRRRSRRRR